MVACNYTYIPCLHLYSSILYGVLLALFDSIPVSTVPGVYSTELTVYCTLYYPCLTLYTVSAPCTLYCTLLHSTVYPGYSTWILYCILYPAILDTAHQLNKTSLILNPAQINSGLSFNYQLIDWRFHKAHSQHNFFF